MTSWPQIARLVIGRAPAPSRRFLGRRRDFTGSPSARVDRSPRINCSVPSIGVQGSPACGSARERRNAAIGDLDPLVAGRRIGSPMTPVSTSIRLCAAVLVRPAERLFADVQDGLVAQMHERRHRQRPHARPLDDHIGIGVHPRQDLAVGLRRSISARSVRLLMFSAHEVRVTVPRIGWSRYALMSTVAFEPICT